MTEPSGSPTPAGVRKSTTYIPEIESLRGVAITLVVAFHAAAIAVPFRGPAHGPGPLWRAWVDAGHTGVSLFFILSGFLLARPFLREIAGGPVVDWKTYYLRRALRILPLYYMVVLVAAVATADAPKDLFRALPYLCFLNSVAGWATPLPPYSSPWWSLATEVQFYLILPLLALCLRSRLWLAAGLALLVAYVVIYLAFAVGWMYATTYAGTLQVGLSFIGRGPLFMLGVMAAWADLRYGGPVTQRLARVGWLRFGGADIMLLSVVCALLVLLRGVAAAGFWSWETRLTVWHVVEGGLWTAVMLLLLWAPLRSKVILCNRLLSSIGVVSYSIYLIHVPVLHFAFRQLRLADPVRFAGWTAYSVAAMAGLALLVMALSSVTYRLIERPFLLYKARLDR